MSGHALSCLSTPPLKCTLIHRYCDRINTLVTCTGTCVDAGIHAAYAKEIGGIICKPLESDIWDVAKKLMERDATRPKTKKLIKPSTTGIAPTVDDYYALVKERNTWDTSIRRVRRDPVTLERELEAVFEKYKGYAGWLLKSNKHAGITGTRETFDEVLKHVRNSCLSDPLPVADMYHNKGKTVQLQRSEYAFLGGSGRCETAHSGVNRRLTGDVSQISEKKQMMNMHLWIYAQNQNRDRKNGLADVVYPGTFFHERNLMNMMAVGVVSEVPFPCTAKKVTGLSGVNFTKQPKNHLFGWDYYNHMQHLKNTSAYERVRLELEEKAKARPSGTTVVPSSSRRSDIVTAGTGEHRIAMRNSSILTSLPVTSLNHDERDLMVRCVTEARSQVAGSESSQFARAEALYIEAAVRNAGEPASQQLNLTGRVTAQFMQEQYRATSTKAAIKRTQASAPTHKATTATKKRKVSSATAPQPQHIKRATAAKKHIADCDPIAIDISGDSTCFKINEHTIGNRHAQCTESKSCPVCNTSDNEIMRAYLQLMKKEVPFGKVLRIGRNDVGKCKQSAHMLEQLTKFFQYRPSKTFTPE
eukprot:COSAG01_NODE_4464_length_5000_cov_37.356662_3_plen_586_part_00